MGRAYKRKGKAPSKKSDGKEGALKTFKKVARILLTGFEEDPSGVYPAERVFVGNDYTTVLLKNKRVIVVKGSPEPIPDYEKMMLPTLDGTYPPALGTVLRLLSAVGRLEWGEASAFYSVLQDRADHLRLEHLRRQAEAAGYRLVPDESSPSD